MSSLKSGRDGNVETCSELSRFSRFSMCSTLHTKPSLGFVRRIIRILEFIYFTNNKKFCVSKLSKIAHIHILKHPNATNESNFCGEYQMLIWKIQISTIIHAKQNQQPERIAIEFSFSPVVVSRWLFLRLGRYQLPFSTLDSNCRCFWVDCEYRKFHLTETEKIYATCSLFSNSKVIKSKTYIILIQKTFKSNFHNFHHHENYQRASKVKLPTATAENRRLRRLSFTTFPLQFFSV